MTESSSSSLQQPASNTTVFLDQPPSCLQFCPAVPDCCVIGTYLLAEQKDESNDTNIKQTKTGSLQLWRINPATNELTLLYKHSLPYAVFDLHFHPRDPSLLSIATSAGSVAFFRLTSGVKDDPPTLTPLLTQPVHEDPSIPALFLAWTPSTWPSITPDSSLDAFAVTFSDSRTTIFQYTPGASPDSPPQITELDTFPASQAIEVWFAALATFHDPTTTTTSSSSQQQVPYIFTGNDFGALHTRRYTSDHSQADRQLSVVLDHHDRARHHTAGVTSILPLPLPLKDDSPVILTGSYDESLRVYHATRRGEVLAEIGLGGGVWRLQLLSSSSSENAEEGWTGLVLASCMHGGTRVVRVRYSAESAEWELEVLAEFTEHESMNYASDVWRPAGGYDLPVRSEGGKQEVVCLSSSFYDRRVCLWRVRL
ncbi:uncharacterized protein BP01DRAFT_347991 [Aspergillus saccharolyticus JOP 1030-1]|uniref:WD40 repeat-like protein n=1 Tax=Aspergillus saccharolyticus JOP 1030-1 TaxID=1450539 RepID=A0A318Z683_9EURO|nr:hypothetical protein BP01DRAFT_347991 [Aspergillus saccharolyticus JOP 1030-1]PYH41954.1 hypothetical protein BP01DRAFT_347991 [Aspergillus saccharolyticus JOP 1030-1]